MLTPRLPFDEVRRLRCLRTLEILDSPPDPSLDAITDLLARQLGCPIALLTLVDRHRQWFKSRSGLATTETPRDLAFCAHAILQHGEFVVPDAQQDVRFFDNPLVTGEPHVVFYAGQPLLVDGHAVGTLCVIDHQPRQWIKEESRLLASMATVVEALLTQQLQARRSALAAARLEDLASAASSNLMWECDESLTLTWVSATGEALFGRSDSAVAGQGLWDGHPLDELGTLLPQGRTLHDLLRQSSEAVSGTFEVTTPTGPRIVGISAVPVIGRGRRQIGWRGVARDMANSVQTRRRLLNVERTEARRRDQMMFMSRVSHELRTPLNAILSFTHLLNDELQDQLAPHHRRWLELVQQGGQHLLSLADDVLALGEHEERPLATAPLGLSEVLAQAGALVSPLAQQVQAQLNIEEHVADVMVTAEGRALTQVLLNVLGNAIKYGPPGGQVTVRVDVIGDDAVIEVSDQGAGIPADRLHRLFMPFERLGTAGANAVGGSGLGLAIAKSLVEAMQGRISAESPAGGGCCIRIAMPLAASVSAGLPEPLAAAA